MGYKKFLARTVASMYRTSQWFGIGPDPISEIMPNRLYIGSIAAASDPVLLATMGITHVVCVTQFGDGARFFPRQVQYHVVEISDMASDDISPYLRGAVRFIEDALRSSMYNSVLIHCVQGHSRSATVTLAYLMQVNNWSLDYAMTFLREKRPVEPNAGFMNTLRRISPV
jgi:hypothetical protein